MKLIVGLGNPGRQYEYTRHNVGFLVIDELCRQHNITLNETKFKGAFGKGMIGGEKVILLKPLTYMNLSGESVRPLMDYYNIEVEDIVIIYDDLDLPTGKVRLRQKGSAGGHNGMKSLIQHLGTQQFNRIRVGIDRPKNGMGVADYVLSNFTKDDEIALVDSIRTSVQACETWMSKPFLQVMNDYN